MTAALVFALVVLIVFLAAAFVGVMAEWNR